MTNLSLERRRASDHHLTLYFFGSQEFARVRRGQTFDEGEFIDVDAARRMIRASEARIDATLERVARDAGRENRAAERARATRAGTE